MYGRGDLGAWIQKVRVSLRVELFRVWVGDALSGVEVTA